MGNIQRLYWVSWRNHCSYITLIRNLNDINLRLRCRWWYEFINNILESWGFREFKLFYEPKEECAIFYTECDFKGAAFDFCAKSPNF